MAFLGKMRVNCNYLNLHSRKCTIRSKCSIVTATKTNNTSPDKPIEYGHNHDRKRLIAEGPNLKDFLTSNINKPTTKPLMAPAIPYLTKSEQYGRQRKVYFDVYGCQMNVNDTEIVWSILQANDYLKTDNLQEADVVLVVTCAIRESAEIKIWHRLKTLGAIRNKRSKAKPKMKIGLLGCMAERLKDKVLVKEQCVDVVAGPDSYKDLPRLLALTEYNQKAVNVLLSLEETYADVMPVRLNENSKTAYVSIMRGCDNMCTYCIVPFTRGRERSRPVASIVQEVERLSESGVKEITLLGQNVNSYRDLSKSEDFHDLKPTSMAKGFKTVYKNKVGGLRFADLLERVADINPEIRIRFTSPHPKDFPDDVLQMIQTKNNICKNLHLPAQSGNSNVLERMRRGYTREAYLDLIWHIKEVLPDVTISSDFICGFCGETEKEFEDTLSLLDTVKYNIAFLFQYSMREKTTAHRRFVDDVPTEIKNNRLKRMAEIYRRHALALNNAQIGLQQLVLIEGNSKRSDQHLVGRNDGNIKVIFADNNIPHANGDGELKKLRVGDYVLVEINDASSQVLKGTPIHVTSLVEYYNKV